MTILYSNRFLFIVFFIYSLISCSHGIHSKNAGDPGTYEVDVLTKLTSGFSKGSIVTFVYTVNVTNHGSTDIKLILGGLRYGYYRNCIADSNNFVATDKFAEKTVRVKAGCNTNCFFSIKLRDSFPFRCAGVPHNQDAVIEKFEKE